LWWRSLGALSDAVWLRRYVAEYDLPDDEGREMLSHDLRFALRSLTRRPVFTAVVVLTLALCIGATTAIFSVVNAVLLEGLPYRDPERLVMVWSNDSKGEVPRNVVSAANYFDWQARSRSFESLGAYFPNWNLTLTGVDEPERLQVAVASSSLFQLLGVRPALGRAFDKSEDVPGSPRAVVLSYGYWQRRYAGDPAIVGKPMMLDGESYAIVGVMPESFVLPGSETAIFASLPTLGRLLQGRIPHLLSVIGRLKPGMTIDRARQDMTSIARALETEYPETNTGWGVTLVPLDEQVSGDVRRPLQILLGAVMLVLLIGCANIGSLTLARTATRQRELALRTALGAGRGALRRQLFVESLLLAAGAAVCGVGLALLGIRALVASAPESLPRLREVTIDARVLGFTALVSLVAAMIFGLMPAMRASLVSVGDVLREAGRSHSGGRRSRRLASAVVGGEIALALILVVGAGLLINSFVRLRSVDPGFKAERAVAMRLALPQATYRDPHRRVAFYDDLIARVRALPSVSAVGAITRLPLNASALTTRLSFEGRAVLPQAERPQVDLRSISGDYFKAMGIPLVAGRAFRDEDARDSAAVPVAVINQTLARLHYRGQNPVGLRLTTDDPSRGLWFTIVGVVGDVRDGSIRDEPAPQIFTNAQQTASSALTIVARTTAAPATLARAVRHEVGLVDPNLPVSDVTTLNQVLDKAVVRERFLTTLLGLFSALALVLAAVGVYGVVNQGITQRTQEIGIRMALGARGRDVVRLIGVELSVVVGGAIIVGLGGAMASTRLLAKLLYGVQPTDIATFSGAAALLALTAALSAAIPARRAARVDPMVTMRQSG
jgi:putative ABC transport system permease protein